MSTKQAELPRLCYTIPELAQMIPVSERQLRRLVAKGDIESKLLGGRILVPASEVERLLAEAPSAAS